MKLFLLISLFASISFAAEEKCQKRDLTPTELSKINSCLDDFSKSSKKPVKLFYDAGGSLYGVETGKDSITVYSSKGSMKSEGAKLTCNTDRSDKVGNLLMSMAQEEYAASKARSPDFVGSITLSGFEKCRQMIPYIKCVNDDLNQELQSLMFKLQQSQMKSGGSGYISPPSSSSDSKNPGAR